MAFGNKQNKYTNKQKNCLEKVYWKIFSKKRKNVFLLALVKIQNKDEAKQMVIKFLCQAGHSFSANNCTHWQNRVKVTKERPVTDWGYNSFLNE